MLYDITPPISPDLKVWPGDTPPRREVLLDMSQGNNLTLSTLHATVHLGAHADAPSHYGPGAASIEAAPLQRYLGPCRVVHVAVDRGADPVEVVAYEQRLALVSVVELAGR